MRRAIALAAGVRTTTSPNPWVGSVIVPEGAPIDLEACFEGATSPPGGTHAEVAALKAAGDRARRSTLYTTLEPCSHQGRTPPCTDAIIEAGVSRVVVGLSDPDPSVDGRGIDSLRRAGIEVTLGVAESEVADQLAAYVTHRRTGRPLVVLKLAATMDGRIAAPDGSSRWITGPDLRRDAHELRRMSDAVLVGAATVRSDDPELTVRSEPVPERQPLRIVLGRAPAGSRVLPAMELSGDPGAGARRARGPRDPAASSRRRCTGSSRVPQSAGGGPLRALLRSGVLRRRRRRPSVRRTRSPDDGAAVERSGRIGRAPR